MFATKAELQEHVKRHNWIKQQPGRINCLLFQAATDGKTELVVEYNADMIEILELCKIAFPDLNISYNNPPDTDTTTGILFSWN